MIARVIRWLRSWRRSWRYKARAHDAKFLFPAIWSMCERSPLQFIGSACVHTANDPNWCGYEDEWQHTPVDPGVWLAMLVNKEAKP